MHIKKVIFFKGKTDHHWIYSEYYLISYWSGKKEEANVQTVKTQSK